MVYLGICWAWGFEMVGTWDAAHEKPTRSAKSLLHANHDSRENLNGNICGIWAHLAYGTGADEFCPCI